MCQANCELPRCLPIPCDLSSVTLENAAFERLVDSFVYVSTQCTCAKLHASWVHKLRRLSLVWA
jgi:hypothetical protein